ncbi:DUF1003 domain-containing protein [Apilactobacillus micheneri]|uniref:DUF1003 domain-containing protein n=1 Tax=Apilactobacillus micheneri TaxID=1899430 RepID=UPI00112E1152|nr:DUF1003 domain-containing protein [Apilactobacillus micheneri]TPR26002.1 DUF1003 domain-containing protein [Apilactobacillus micheneri]TPR28192.1 DUF1003 domain-containing protein [Apilactobacillus micheneri]TPR29683.1 DUF1003 domain-containing protein [Apilactobacillus micheneri]TPR30469.1 DUF1003 domain-containing protein [Apilactobacillus micheneri]TPR31169.1 DUF1003 domain-containing protein [Apilactobacillus micheneri]
MNKDSQEQVKCLADGKTYLRDEGVILKELAQPISNAIKQDYPKAKMSSFICANHLLEYRMNRVDSLINSDLRQSQKINRKLTKALKDDNYEITDVNVSLSQSTTFGQKVSDAVAKFGGSWTFIFIFIAILLIWMLINGLAIFGIHFDPYPYILLNLFLSCFSAIQAPIIMMSQNRSAQRDRLDAENDFHVNLKSEHELRILHAKLDHLTQNQMPHDLEIEKLQLQILGEVRSELTNLRNENIKLKAQLKQQKQN